jgi:hypothetical protein
VGRIGRVIKQEIEKFIGLVLETRKGYNQKTFLYNSSGDDSPPVKNDRVILITIDGTGKYISAGILTESQGAKPGEKYLFSRDADGVIQSIIKMLQNGTIDAVIKKDLIVKADSDITSEAAKKNTVKGANVELNGKVKATGGSFECAGIVSPTGNGALCGCKFCYVTGAPVAGSLAEGT